MASAAIVVAIILYSILFLLLDVSVVVATLILAAI